MDKKQPPGVSALPASAISELGMHLDMEGVRHAQRVSKLWHNALSGEDFLARLAGPRFANARLLEEAKATQQVGLGKVSKERSRGKDPRGEPHSMVDRKWTPGSTAPALLPCLIAWRERDLAQIRLGREWNFHREGLQNAVEAAMQQEHYSGARNAMLSAAERHATDAQ